MAALGGGDLLATPPGINSSARLRPQSRHVSGRHLAELDLNSIPITVDCILLVRFYHI